MFISSGSAKDAVGHRDSVMTEAGKTNRSRENVFEIYRFVLEELQKQAHASQIRKMIATDHYRDLVGQHHLRP